MTQHLHANVTNLVMSRQLGIEVIWPKEFQILF
jgi:hypothetical protein